MSPVHLRCPDYDGCWPCGNYDDCGGEKADRRIAITERRSAIKEATGHTRCVAISTKASVYEMIIPGVLAVAAPLFIGYLLGAEALGGMLVGGICCGFMLAVYMANAGGAWDNGLKV